MTIFNLEDIFADTGTVSLQKLNNLPTLPAWLTPVGQGYRFLSDELFPRVIAFDYLQRDAPAGYEHTLRVYYSPDDGESWQRLETGLETAYNQATAVMPQDGEMHGEGIYALLATVEMPPFVAGWNQFGYPIPGSRPVGPALASIDGAYSSVTYQDLMEGEWLLYDDTVIENQPEYAALVNDLTALEFGRAYWLHATQAITLYLGVAEESELPRGTAGTPGLPPATFYGPISATNKFTPTPGMTLTALIDGVVCGESSVISQGEQLVYKIQVAADSGEGCGAAGRPVRFELDGQVMTHRPWDNSQVWFHPLAASSYQVYLPLLVKGNGLVGDPRSPISRWWPLVLLPAMVLLRRKQD